MHIGIQNKSTVWTLRICFLLFVVLSSYFWNFVGFVAALVVVCFVDRIWPKWASVLTWDDIYIALCNLSSFGVTGSRLILKISGRQLFVGKDVKNGKSRLAVMFPTDEWDDIFSSEKDVKNFAKKMESVCYIEIVYNRKTCILKPKKSDNLEETCFRILKHTFLLTGKSINADVVACVDSIKRVAWIKYDDVEYRGIGK